MLTHNFAEIIGVVIEKSKENTLKNLSCEDIGSISLMLLGYLRLIKSDFKTPEDSPEARDSYFSNLKAILNELVTTQTLLLDAIKKGMVMEFHSDIDALNDKMEESLRSLTVGSPRNQKQVQKDMLKVQESLKELKEQAGKELLEPYAAFDGAIHKNIELGYKIKDEFNELAERDANDALSSYGELVQETLMHHFKKWVKWNDIERNKEQCSSYVISEAYIDYI